MNLGEWRSVDEEKPPKCSMVLCLGNRGGMFLGYHVYGSYFDVPNARSHRRAIAWHPLPELPMAISPINEEDAKRP